MLDARQISQAFGSSYIGPEHLLFALAVNPDSAAGRELYERRITPETLQRAAAGGGGCQGTPPPSETPTVDEFGSDLTAMAREGRVDPVVGREDEIERTVDDGRLAFRATEGEPASTVAAEQAG